MDKPNTLYAICHPCAHQLDEPYVVQSSGQEVRGNKFPPWAIIANNRTLTHPILGGGGGGSPLLLPW